MDLTQRYSKNPSTIYREEEDGAFLFDPETGNLKYMNRTAKEVFVLLNGQTDVNQLVEHLVRLYPEMEAHQILDDVAAFLQQLKENEFIISLAET